VDVDLAGTDRSRADLDAFMALLVQVRSAQHLSWGVGTCDY
jgi:hypothetical protein